MTDINTGGLGSNIPRTTPNKTDMRKPTGEDPTCAETDGKTQVKGKETDLYGAGAVSGRSLVQKIKEDTFDKDMERLAQLYKEHPELVDKLDSYFDEFVKYYDKSGAENSYGQASRDLRLLVEELASK